LLVIEQVNEKVLGLCPVEGTHDLQVRGAPLVDELSLKAPYADTVLALEQPRLPFPDHEIVMAERAHGAWLLQLVSKDYLAKLNACAAWAVIVLL
jgi:hypothetical protein